jgi:peptidoglycan/LPS O-acetylase OafA/YrhL
VNNAPEQGQRREIIPELYVLRGLALMGIVFQHAMGVYIRRENIPFADAVMIGMLFNLTKFAVPAFVFAAGMALFYNYYKKLNYPLFLSKRILEILLPYMVWTAIYDVYYHGIPTISPAWLAAFGKNVLLGTGEYHLWFVVLIFQFYLFYPVVLALFKLVRAGGEFIQYLAVGLLAALFAALMWFSSSYIPLHDFHFENQFLQAFLIEYRDRNFIYFLFYFILGGIAGVSLMKWREFVERAAGWNSFIFVNLYILIGYELMKSAPWGGVNLNYSTSFKPSMFFYAVSAIILLYGLSVVIAKYRSLIFQSLEQIGRLSYGIYLAHALVLVYAVRTADLLLPSGQALWLSVLAFVFCMLGSWGIVFILSMVPGSGIVIGPHRKKAPR